MGASWRVLAASWRVLGASWGRLSASWHVLGASWRVLEASWARLGRVLGTSWAPFGASWAQLGTSSARLVTHPVLNSILVSFFVDFSSQHRPHATPKIIDFQLFCKVLKNRHMLLNIEKEIEHRLTTRPTSSKHQPTSAKHRTCLGK